MSIQTLAEHAVTAWGGTGEARFLSHRENAVFDVSLPTGRAALRLHRPGYRSDAEILSELDWTLQLAEGGFPAPAPVPMPNGDWILHLGDGQRATVIGWMSGAPLGDASDLLTLDSVTEYGELGELLARLHDATIAMGAMQFDRPYWDIDGLTGEQPLWGRYWEMSGLSRDQSNLIIAARDKARADLQAYLDGGAQVTLIHTDALRENVFRTDDGLVLIDFDDSGFGFTMYDLAASVTQVVDDPMYPKVRAAIMEGYARVRGLSDADRGMFDIFAMLRAFSALGWTMPRLEADHPKLPIYVRRAMEMAEAYLSE